MEGCQEETIHVDGVVVTRFTRNGQLVATRKISVDEDGTTETWRDSDDLKHRDNRPAVTVTAPDGEVTLERWYVHGRMERGDDQPAYFERFDDGAVEYWWHKRGVFWRRKDKPAMILINGEHVRHGWHKASHYRKGGRPHVEKLVNGVVHRQEWRYGDDMHRDDGPAVIKLVDGAMRYKYYKHGARCSPKTEERLRIPSAIRQAMRVLPLPISDAILQQYWHDWQFM